MYRKAKMTKELKEFHNHADVEVKLELEGNNNRGWIK